MIEEIPITFDLYLDASGTPADGVSVNFGGIPAGNGAGEGGFAMDGGLAIGWDTYSNGGEQKSVEVFANGVSILNYVWDFNTVFGAWVPVVVHWDEDGLDLSYNGTVIANDLATPGFVPKPGDSCAFSARTGGATEDCFIDDLEVVTAPVTPVLTGGPMISEFLADNEDTLEDDESGLVGLDRDLQRARCRREPGRLLPTDDPPT